MTDYNQPGQHTTVGKEKHTDVTHTHHEERNVCDQEFFLATEDRPIMIERRERIREHHPVEVEYERVVRATGLERPAGERHREVVGVFERVVEEAEPMNACDILHKHQQEDATTGGKEPFRAGFEQEPAEKPAL